MPFMVSKRHSNEQEGSVRESKRPFSVVRDVMRGLSLDDIVLNLEPFLRRVVREEVERRVLRFRRSSPRSTLSQIDSFEVRRWQLHFDNKLPPLIYTGSRIEAADNGPIRVVIVDASSGTRITSGSLSSLKIEILVLNGDFGTDDQEDWTEEEFTDHVVREREGKRPLLAGGLYITLSNGVGYITDISFTDNSSWIRTRMFRLGARLVQKQNISGEVRVREARSESFVVKDHRGESYKKHYPPSLGDEVWRLKKIAKDGAFHTRLSSQQIHTVKDFLQLYAIDKSSLRTILGCGISNKLWDAIIEHASACVLDDGKLYFYRRPEHRVGLLFNSIYKLIGVIFDGQSYQPLDALSLSQMDFVEKMKLYAYKNVNDFIPIDDPSVAGPSRPLLCPQADPLSDPSLALQNPIFPFTDQDQRETHIGFYHSTLPSHTYEDDRQHSLHPMQGFRPTLTNSFRIRDTWSGAPYNGGQIWTPNGSSSALTLPIGESTLDDISQVQTLSSSSPVTATWGQGNSFLFTSSLSNEAEGSVFSPLPHFGVCISRSRSRPKAGWCKIRAAVKWGIVIRRNVAARRMAAPWGMYQNY